MSNYKLLAGGRVLRLDDGACIPPTTDNLDWVYYQAWLAAGGKPQPADPVLIPPKTLSDGALATLLVQAGKLTQEQVDAAIAQVGAS